MDFVFNFSVDIPLLLNIATLQKKASIRREKIPKNTSIAFLQEMMTEKGTKKGVVLQQPLRKMILERLTQSYRK